MPDTPIAADNIPSSSQDPIKALAEILKDEGLTAEDKQLLYKHTTTRFRHRRIMAYIALISMIGFGIIDAFFAGDGFDVGWVNSTLAAIVFAYYGMSAWKPNS